MRHLQLSPTFAFAGVRYPETMTENEHLHRHIDLCRRMQHRMLTDGTWPWGEETESPNPEIMVESEDLNDVT